MRTSAQSIARRAVLATVLACWAIPAFAQTLDTLSYDGIGNIMDGQLLAVTRFPDELDVIFNARFTPEEKCLVTGVILGFSDVKFDLTSGDDTLRVWVFEDSPVPPLLRSIVKTFTYRIGDMGFPAGNVAVSDPLGAPARGVQYVAFDTPVPLAPKRDFIIGVRLDSRQVMTVGNGTWNGLTLLVNRKVPEYQRYRRYFIFRDPAYSKNTLATQSSEIGLYIRAVVQYDPAMRDVVPTGTDAADAAPEFGLEQNYPNPAATSGTRFAFHLPADADVTLTLHDALGRHVATVAHGAYGAGRHETVAGPDMLGTLPPGMYLARLAAGTRQATRLFLLL